MGFHYILKPLRSSLVSTLEFVLGRDVQLPLESAHSLFSYTGLHSFAYNKLKEKTMPFKSENIT